VARQVAIDRHPGGSRPGRYLLGRMHRHRKAACLRWSLILTVSAALSGGFGTLSPGAVFAASGTVAAGQVPFDIPSQALTTALETFSEVTGIQVLYDSHLTSGRRSAAVKGVLMPQAALRSLLAGTDIKVRYANSHGIVLVSASAVEAPEAAGNENPPVATGTVLDLGTLHLGEGVELGGAADYHGYGEFIKTEVQSALHRDGSTRSGDYNVGLQLWLNSSGIIQRSHIFRSSGDKQRDASIIRTIRNLTISQPPPTNLPEPVSIIISSRPE
jgi:hypothetical protein